MSGYPSSHAQIRLTLLVASITVLFSPITPCLAAGQADMERRAEEVLKRFQADKSSLMIAQMSQQLRKCWQAPPDAVAVTVGFGLGRNGEVEGEPQVIRPRADANFQASANAAIQAIKSCAPFKLPPDRYEFWQTLTWDFIPAP